MRVRTYSELRQLETLKERFEYLKLHGVVGESTFGFDRWMNQGFYTSQEWRNIRIHVIARDGACDLGISGYEVHNRLTIHHMNPMTVSEIKHGDASILDPEYLISVSNQTHNAIHYGDERLLPRPFVPRRPGDTNLW
jgi:hypothetical protein